MVTTAWVGSIDGGGGGGGGVTLLMVKWRSDVPRVQKGWGGRGRGRGRGCGVVLVPRPLRVPSISSSKPTLSSNESKEGWAIVEDVGPLHSGCPNGLAEWADRPKYQNGRSIRTKRRPSCRWRRAL